MVDGCQRTVCVCVRPSSLVVATKDFVKGNCVDIVEIITGFRPRALYFPFCVLVVFAFIQPGGDNVKGEVVHFAFPSTQRLSWLCLRLRVHCVDLFKLQ